MRGVRAHGAAWGRGHTHPRCMRYPPAHPHPPWLESCACPTHCCLPIQVAPPCPAHPSAPARVACRAAPSPLPACWGRAASPRPPQRVGGRGATCRVQGRLVCVSPLGCAASIRTALLHVHRNRAKGGGGHSLDPVCTAPLHANRGRGSTR
jgi:hypothetical protein